MYFKDGDIFLGFARLVSFLRLEFHSSSPRDTFKI